MQLIWQRHKSELYLSRNGRSITRSSPSSRNFPILLAFLFIQIALECFEWQSFIPLIWIWASLEPLSSLGASFSTLDNECKLMRNATRTEWKISSFPYLTDREGKTIAKLCITNLSLDFSAVLKALSELNSLNNESWGQRLKRIAVHQFPVSQTPLIARCGV